MRPQILYWTDAARCWLGRTRPRRVHAFGVGTAKSGTNSLTRMFRLALRARHEPETEKLVAKILDHAAGRLTDAEFEAYAKARDDRLNLELCVDGTNGYIVDTLYSLFPDARYILTIRDAKSWLRSFINQQLTLQLPADSVWHPFRNLRFHSDGCSPDVSLKHTNLYALDGYLAYWLKHNRNVIQTVSADQLLIVPMQHLGRDSDIIAEFLNVDPSKTNRRAVHIHRGRYGSDPLDQFDQALVHSLIEAHTNKLLDFAAGKLPDSAWQRLREGVAYA